MVRVNCKLNSYIVLSKISINVMYIAILFTKQKLSTFSTVETAIKIYTCRKSRWISYSYLISPMPGPMRLITSNYLSQTQ